MYRAKDAVDFFDMIGQTEWHRDLQRTLIHWIGLRDGYNVLEVGCGSGHFLLQLAPRVNFVTGLDSSDVMLHRAELNAEDNQLDNASFTVGNIHNLPFPDEKFHLTICMNLVFMLQNPVEALREMLRVTQNDGEVILVNPSPTMNPWSMQTYCDVNGLRDFERDSLLSFATAAARHGTMDEDALKVLADGAGGILTGTLQLLDGFVTVSRIKK